MGAWILSLGILLALAPTIVVVLVGLVIARYIYVANRRQLAGARARQLASGVLLHVRNEQSSAWPHVMVNLCLSIALAGFIATLVAWIASDAQRPGERLSIGLSVGSIAFSLIASIATFWTLWQTFRIEMRAGYHDPNFRAIVVKIADEIDELVRQFRVRQLRSIPATDYERVLIVGLQPFYGMFTFRDQPEGLRMEHALEQAAQEVENGLRLEILCADVGAMGEWHKEYFLKHPDGAKQASAANRKVENLIAHISKQAEPKRVFWRSSAVPEAEAIVVGDTVFEFTIDKSQGRSAIQTTHIRSDPRIARKEEAVFGLIQKGIDAAASSEDATRDASKQAHENDVPPVASSAASTA